MLWNQDKTDLIMQLVRGSQKHAGQVLVQQDEKYLQWKLSEVLDRLPAQLQPPTEILKHATFYSLMLAKQNKQAASFPMVPAIINAGRSMASSQRSRGGGPMGGEQGGEGGDFVVEEPVGVESMPQGLNQSQKVRTQPKDVSHIKVFAPFVSSKHNCWDVNANSKGMEQRNNPYLKFGETSHNISRMAQNSKFSAFSGGRGYPSSVMKGNVSRPGPGLFAKESSLDLKDVMRYTLNQHTKPDTSNQPIANPFIKIPQRFQ